jgi:large subunit ribosomal protein L14e
MFDIGRVCMKIAGRDAGMKCFVVDVIDEHYVMIDGQTRRRKCNIKHLEPLAQIVQINKNAPAPEIVRALKELGVIVEEKKPRAKPVATKPKTERPKRARKKKEKPVKETKAKPAKDTKKKAEKSGKAEKPIEKKADVSEKKE